MKKLFAVLLVVLSVFAFSVVASAENENVLGYTLESSDSLVYSGDTVTVNVVISENTGFVHSIVDVTYDAEIVTYVESSKDSTVYNASKLTVNNPKAGTLRVSIGDMMAAINPGDAEVFTATGTVVSLTFKVNEDYEGDITFTTAVDVKNTLNSKGEMTFVISTGSLTLTAISENHEHTASEEVVPGKAATCTESGLTDGSKCAVCGEVYGQEEIPALGHSEETVAGKDATCTESGLTDGSKCTVCGETVVEQEEIPALGHTEEVVAAVAPTCTETGLTEGKKCSVCGTVTVAQETVEATGHSWDWVTDKEPTTTEEGEKHEECACGAKQSEGTVIEKLPAPVDSDIPQMGDNNTVIVLLVVACVALAGVYFTAKRKVTR